MDTEPVFPNSFTSNSELSEITVSQPENFFVLALPYSFAQYYTQVTLSKGAVKLEARKCYFSKSRGHCKNSQNILFHWNKCLTNGVIWLLWLEINWSDDPPIFPFILMRSAANPDRFHGIFHFSTFLKQAKVYVALHFLLIFTFNATQNPNKQNRTKQTKSTNYGR